ncbi:serine/threonine-protein kinase Nek5-like [Stegodyphus dumicola]|uniref:serine/threonine-protein kinase Nek5-like n=1 Tax=Stegodyphus dumicola TaxID=202533 RepID=UPI0015AA6145|nr:serine/threonine-protein kinase Nek5-like [Stegodyphus dumicola]
MAKCSLNATRYEKEKLIGSGTYGNVWLVRSKHSRISHVLKEINLKSLDACEQQQALTEVAILSKCQHRNIIRYKEAMIEHDRGILSIIMEYADGGDLYTAITRQKGVPFKEPHVHLSF